MSALHLNELLPALSVEGGVTVFKGQRGYEVSFRYGGRQYNRKLKTRKYSVAKSRAAAVFAEVVHGERDAAQARTIDNLYLRVDELTSLVRNLALSLPFSNAGVSSGQPIPTVGKEPSAALLEFLNEKKTQVSEAQYDNLRKRCTKYVEYIVKQGVTDVARITREHLVGWLESQGDIAARTFNVYKGDIGVFLNFCEMRNWRAGKIVVQKRKTQGAMREVISPSVASALMSYIESERPEFASYFALALFAGVRASTGGSELTRLAATVARDGWPKYLRDGYLWIPEPKCESSPRRIQLFANLKAWLEKYPALICPTRPQQQYIAKKLSIPKNALRHTAISSFVCSSKGTLTEAALFFGNSEAIIRKHYLSLISQENAKALYGIYPRDTNGPVPPVSHKQ